MSNNPQNHPEKIGRYVIVREQGRGGMATVYRARDPQFERDVAVKVLPAEFSHNPHFRERFRREAHAIAALEHNAIVPVYDYGDENNVVYLVMRYMQGGSLADVIEQKGALELDQIARILEQICPALDAAHSKGVIHRDVKPGNILFDEYGSAYVSDFGLVKIGESASSLTGSMLVGTPSYMAPELSQETGVSSLIDVYAIGVTLYQMLTGNVPYSADTPLGTVLAHVVEPIPDVREIRDDVPEQISQLVKRAIAKLPENRYQNATEIATDFREAIRGGRVSRPIDQAFEVSESNAYLRTPSQVFSNPEEKNINITTLVAIGALSVALILVVILLISSERFGSTAMDPTATDVQAAIVEPTQTEEPTAEPTATQTEAPTVTPTLTPTTTPTPQTTIALGGGGEYIAFSSDQNGTDDIYLVSLETEQQIPLVSNVSLDIEPTWSPDGSRLAFTSDRRGHRDIWVINADGSNLDRLTDNPADEFAPAWSPDGSKIAFISTRDASDEIYILDLATGEEQRLTNNRAQEKSPAWSPDGETIAAVSNLNGNDDIYIFDAVSGIPVEQLTNNFTIDQDPAWAPDGNRIAFSSSRDGDFDIYIANLALNSIEPLTFTPTYEGEPWWSPDGELISFIAGDDLGFRQRVIRINVTSGNIVELTVGSGAFNASGPVWQPQIFRVEE